MFVSLTSPTTGCNSQNINLKYLNQQAQFIHADVTNLIW